jgi:hypothetical protein
MGLRAIENMLKHHLPTQQLQQRVGELSTVCPHYASCVLVAAAQMHVQARADQLRPVTGRLLQQQSEANACSIARALYAFAISRWYPPTQELGLLMARFAELLPDVSTADVSRLLWAVSSIDELAVQPHIHRLQQPIWDHMLSQLLGASPLTLCSALHVTASTQLHMPQQYVQQAMDELPRQLPGCGPMP